ncbi:MAG: histidine kinase [Anaerolineales bacterium]|nr:histidine kinase [Anaerolineales bacterium]
MLAEPSGSIAQPPKRGALRPIIDFVSQVNLSIRTKILLSFLVVIALFALIDGILINQVMSFNRAYDAIITNITTANSINGYVKTAVDTEMWNIVAGKTEFSAGRQYAIIGEVEQKLRTMKANTDSQKAKLKLDVILRTMNTLTRYVDLMGEQIQQGSRVAANERVLENIRGVTDLVNDLVQEYMLFEVDRAGQNYRDTQSKFLNWMIIYLITLAGAIVFAIGAAWVISESIYVPIKKLHNVTHTLARGDLQVFVNRKNADEIADLGVSFNVMIGKIRELLDAEIREQENLKKAEFRALQAQINPHFLYNTLDTIVWMAEARKNDQVIEIVHALTSFFRISLSRGRDWISIRDEVEHTRSYLTIQKMRYRDILDYEMEVDDAVLSSTILKLTLQPLVENALYHGIKNKRNGGKISVRVRTHGPGEVLLEVEDNGIGFTPARLEQIREEMNSASTEIKLKESGFGIENVSKRIQLYYGRQYGVAIESTYHVGTKVSLRIPRRELLHESAENGLGPQFFAHPA